MRRTVVLSVFLAAVFLVPSPVSATSFLTSPPSVHPHVPDASPTWATICDGCTDNNSPSGATLWGREYGAMTYDAADNYTVLFGGWVSANSVVDGTTWVYENGVWHVLATQLGNGKCHYSLPSPLAGQEGPCPTAREGASMAYDPVLDGAILYGGTSWAGYPYEIAQDAENNGSYTAIPFDTTTWEFTRGQWVAMSTPAPNAGTAFASMTYDPSLGGVVMGGGLYNYPDPTCDNADDRVAQYDFSSLYVLNSTSEQWTTVPSNTGNSPGTMYGVSMAYDPITDTLFIEGGGHINSDLEFDSGCTYTIGTVDYFGDTWIWKGGPSGGWTDEQTNPGSSNVLGSMVYDQSSGQLLLVSGGSPGAMNWVDQWSGSSWADTSIGGPGPAGTQVGSSSAYDAKDSYVILLPGTNGANSVTLSWPPPITSSVSSYPGIVDAGKSFSATVSVSSPLASAQGWGYRLNWTRNGAASGSCAYGWTAPGGSSQAVATCSAPGAPGTYGLSLVVTVGNSQPSNAAQVSRVTGGSAVVVYPVMVPSVDTYPAPAWVESGATIYLNGTVASPGSSTPGGDAPYSFGWANLSCRNILGNPNTSHVQCVSGAAGSYNTTFTVRDATGATASTSVSLTIYSPISITKPNWLNQDIDSGTSVTLSALVSGGYPNSSARIYNWSGLPSGCTSSNAAQVTCHPTVVSSPYHPNICLNVTDPSGTAGVCGYSTVEPPLKVLSYSSNRSSVDGNQWVGFTLTVSGGTGSYGGTSWMISDVSTGVPLTCNGNHFSNSSLQSTISTGCQAPNALSNQTLKADVTAADGSLNGYQASSLSMPIYPDPYVTQSNASSYSVYNNKTVDLYGAAAMGTGDYSYAWTGLPSGCTSQNVSVLVCTPDVTAWPHGSYSIFNIYLWINDSNGYPASWNGVTDSQSVKHPIVLTVYKSPFLLVNNPPGADVGQSVTFNLVYNGAYGTVVGISWQGLPAAVSCSIHWLITGSYSAHDICQVTTPGSYQLAVQVNESKPNTNITYAWLNVSSDMLIGTLTVPSGQTVGQVATFTLSGASGGLLPYTFTWDLSAIGCKNQTTGSQTLWVSCVPTISGSHQVTVVGTDGNGYSWNGANRTATVMFGVSPTISITPAPAVTESGLYTVFSSVVGSGSFNYVWTITPNAACTPSGSVTYKNCTWSSAGTYAVNLTLTNAAGYVNSTNVSYGVLSNPSGLLKETRSYLDIGQSVRLTTVVAGGVSPYTFTWLNLPGGCPSVNRSSVTCTPTMSGNFSVSVKLSDALGFNATTNSVNFTVVGGPTLSTPLSHPPSIDGGQAVNFTVRVMNSSGGDIYSWSGLPSTCPPSTTPTITCPSLPSGSYPVVATVTDSNGLSATSPTLQYTVLSDPTVKLSGPSGSVDASEPVRFTALAANGTGVYHYAWSALTPFSCPTVNAPTDVCTAIGSGTGTVTVTVTDSNGVTTRTGLTVTANPALLVNVTLSSGSTSMPLNQSSYQNGYLLTMKAGTSFTVDGSATGGLPPYSLNVTVNGTVVGKGSNQSSLSATTSIPTVGVFPVDFSVTDRARTVVVQGAVQITGTPMNVSLQAPLVTNASVPVNLTAVVSGGVGPFSYHWAAQGGSFGSVMNNTTTTTPTVAVRWSAPGHYNVSVTVVDGQNLHVYSQTTIAVGNNPLTITWSAYSPIDANATENVTVAVKGGTAPYTYHWYQQGAPGGDHWTTTAPYSYLEWLTTGTFNASVTVVDAHGASGTMGGVFVVGTGISIRCSPTESGSLVVGNRVTFSLPCSPQGGIPPYTYTWQLIKGSNPDVVPLANGTGPTFTYTFQSSGNYLVIAQIADSTHLVGAQTPPGSFMVSSTGGGNGLGALTGSLLFWVVLLPILALVAFLLLVFLMARKKRRSTPSQPPVLMGSPDTELSPLQWAILEHLEGHPLEEQDRLALAVGNAQKVSPSEVRSAIGLLGPMGLLDSRQNVEDKETRYELTDSGKKFLAKHRAASTPPVSEIPADETAISGTRGTRTEPTDSTPATGASTPSPAKDGTVSPPGTHTSSPSGHKILGEERKATDEANPYQGRVKPEDVNPQLAGKKTIPSELLQPMELQQVKDRGAGARAPPGRSGVDYEAKARELEAKAKGGTPPPEAQPERRRLRDHLPRKKEGNSNGKS